MQQYNEIRFKFNYPNAKLGVILNNDGYTFVITNGEDVLYSEETQSQIKKEDIWSRAYSKLQDTMKYDAVIEICNCDCHKPGVVMMHFMPCCSGNGESIKKIKL